MNRWEQLDSEHLPDGSGVMDLLKRDTELAIHVNGRQLMSSRVHGSEDALADLACAIVGARPRARVLVGGLGMGFTLAAALRGVGPQGRVVVAELSPAVLRWNQGVLGPVAGSPLDDPRASVYQGDVADLIDEPDAPWDAILLDVDNGPDALSHPDNAWLYDWPGLGAAHAALSRGGVLGVWSAFDDRAFTRLMGRVGFRVETHTVRARGAKGGRRHVIWIGRK
jgi:spermidine synthase